MLVGGLTMSVLVVPSSWIVAVIFLHFTQLTLLVFCCRFQPVKGDDQETRVSALERVTLGEGVPGVARLLSWS